MSEQPPIEDVSPEFDTPKEEQSSRHRSHRYHPLHDSSTESNTRNIAGMLVVVFGAYLLLEKLQIIRIDLGDIFATWWPLAVIYLGFELIAKNKPAVRTVWYIILIAALAYILMTGIFR